MSTTGVIASRTHLLDGYRRAGRRVALIVLVLAIGGLTRGIVDPVGGPVVRLLASTFGEHRMSLGSALILGAQAVSLWLIGRGRLRTGTWVSAAVSLVALVALGVGVGCDSGLRPSWCQGGDWPQLLPSTQGSFVLALLAGQVVMASSGVRAIWRLRVITLLVVGVLAAGTGTAVALGLESWTPLVRIQPMRGATALVALLLVIAAIGVLTDHWPLGPLVRTEADRAIVSHLLPWILAVPFFPGAAGLFGRWVGASTVTIAVMVAVGPALIMLAALAVAVGDQRRASQRLAVALRQYELTVEQSSIGIALVSPEGRFLAVNSQLCELFQRDSETLLAMTVDELTHPDDVAEDLQQIAQCLRGELTRYEMEKRYLLPDGGWLPALLSKALVRDDDGAPVHFVSQVIDMTERRRVEDRLRDAAGRDPLTWLANRRGLEQWFDERPATTGLGVVYIDLDEFKPVNDTYGHPFGDRVLQTVAELLRAEVRADDAVARLGGDEFVIVCDGLADDHDFARMVGRLRKALDGRATIRASDGVAVAIRASIGAVEVEDDTTLSEALSRADHAMYEVKRTHRA